MIELFSKVSPIYEGMNYLYNKANCITTNKIIESIRSIKPSLRHEVLEYITPINQLTEIIDAEININDELCNKYFKMMDSFSADHYLARLIISPVCYCSSSKSIYKFVEAIHRASESDRLNYFLCTIVDDTNIPINMDYRGFIEYIFSMNISSSDKTSIIDAYNRLEESIAEVLSLIIPVAECVERHNNIYDEYIERWRSLTLKSDRIGEFIYDCFNFCLPNAEYTAFPSILHPLQFGISVWKDFYNDTIKREESIMQSGNIAINFALLPLFSSFLTENSVNNIVNIIKGLADETRYEILCNLNNAPTYGQALADIFNMTPQKIFYHMNRLLSSNIVECNLRNGKTYYNIDKETIAMLIEALQKFL